ncbi:MAG TPA: maltotransferase domain-containing protein, partial [Acidimicrobiales bacterium]|nr:maltotransferase domain-containing protein [Acidimicrobiales bacterium]
VGEPVAVGARVFADGHDWLRVVVSHRPPGAAKWVEVPMASTNPGLDRWEATFVPELAGRHRFRVRAWIDETATWRDALARKVEAGVDEPVDHEDEPRPRFPASAAETSPEVTVEVEPERALFSTWYELFPRSAGSGPGHGTFADVVRRLDDLADHGFDVVYLPPIHPIGRSFRKGPNNAEGAGPGDPGSPWAIGASEGGHTAIHPELGTLADFDALVVAARDREMEVALDLAFQCSPDHPWVREHPQWFRHRPDGTIQYAENPPKRYQDIYPLDFASVDWRALWDALLDVTLFWCERGVRTFRVDNPHTKPFAFWEWLLAEVRARHPHTVFLSEAFTRPAPMHRLAQVGFTQSYTYFTWRTTRDELVEYFTELSSPPSVDELRPNVWPNTPDILPWHLQHAPAAMFALRLVLAATLSPSYGIYGPAFELCESSPAGNGKEEYLDSEKYQLRRWDLDQALNLRPLVAEINTIRRDHLAFHTLRTLRFHGCDNGALLCFSKTPHAGPCVDPERPSSASMLVVVNLDPHLAESGTLELDLAALGVDPERPYDVEDLLGGCRFTWRGDRPWVELDPGRHPAHVLRVSQPPVGETGPAPVGPGPIAAPPRARPGRER